jgi:hypothetical protein
MAGKHIAQPIAETSAPREAALSPKKMGGFAMLASPAKE